MPRNLKPIEQLSMREIEIEQIRNLRMISLDIVQPVQFDSNIPLSDELKAYYEGLKDIPSRIREAICDNIKIEDITKLIPWGMTVKNLLSIAEPLIKNKSDFAKYMVMDGWN